jgi:anti-sigma factor RsiW
MTDCGNAEIRDLLPDLAAGALSPVERSRVQAHVDGCAECAAEVALLRTARALRPNVTSIDIAAIVARLPRPEARPSVVDDPSIVSLDAHRELQRASRQSRRAMSWTGSRSVWRMAAAVGVIIAGGWSVVMVQSGGIGVMTAGRADSAQFAETTAVIASADPSPRSDVAVSFGDLGDYTEEELKRVLDRVENWDGATSTEAVTTAPILPASVEGVRK